MPQQLQLQRVVRSTIIDAPIERVWAVLRDFNSHDQWHAVVDSSRIESNERSDQVGCVRSFTLKDGNRIREQLLSLSDTEHTSRYAIIEATVPLQRYVATVTLKPVTDGRRTFWHWESTFATPPGQEQALHDLVAQGVYEAGFENLRRHLAQGADQRSPGGLPLPTAVPVASRQVVVRAHGSADQLVAEDTKTDAPGPGQVRIQQRAIGVNFFDVYLRRGDIPALLPAGAVPGMEAAGSVLDVGEGVFGFSAGDRVAYLGPQPGAYCTVRCVPAAWVLRLPPAVEDITAAATLLKGLTADMILRDLAHVRAGTRVLVHAAAGGVGLLLCAWAKRLGAQVIGTVSNTDKARVARAHGCDAVIVTPNHQFARAVQSHFAGGNPGADLVVDGLGEAAREENFAALARCGHWVSLGQATGALQPVSPDWLVQKSISFSRPVVFDFVAEPRVLAERAQRLWSALADGSVKAPPIERWSLDAASQAHARLESRGTSGALVLLA
jgi:NADPH:quinone reductase